MSSEARQRTRVQTRPAHTWGVLILSVVVLSLGAGLVYQAVKTLRGSKEGRVANGSTTTISQLPLTPAYLMMAVDRTGIPVSFAALAPASTGGGSILIIPASTRVQPKASLPSERLADAFVRGGAKEQTEAVSRLLGIEFAGSYIVTTADFTALLTPYAPVAVTLDGAVVDTDVKKADRVLHPAGPVSLGADAAAELFVARADGESETVRLPRIEALWKSVAARAAVSPAISAAPGSLSALLDGVVRGPTLVYRFASSNVIDPAINPLSLDLLAVDVVDIRMKMAQLLPGAVSSADSNIRVEIRDPFHNEALVRETVILLTFLGAHVVFIHDINDLPLPTTSVLFEAENRRGPADFLAKTMGKNPATLATSPLENVDVSIILGTDRRDEAAARIATSTTAATTVVSTTKP